MHETFAIPKNEFAGVAKGATATVAEATTATARKRPQTGFRRGFLQSQSQPTRRVDVPAATAVTDTSSPTATSSAKARSKHQDVNPKVAHRNSNSLPTERVKQHGGWSRGFLVHNDNTKQRQQVPPHKNSVNPHSKSSSGSNISIQPATSSSAPVDGVSAESGAAVEEANRDHATVHTNDLVDTSLSLLGTTNKNCRKATSQQQQQQQHSVSAARSQELCQLEVDATRAAVGSVSPFVILDPSQPSYTLESNRESSHYICSSPVTMVSTCDGHDGGLGDNDTGSTAGAGAPTTGSTTTSILARNENHCMDRVTPLIQEIDDISLNVSIDHGDSIASPTLYENGSKSVNKANVERGEAPNHQLSTDYRKADSTSTSSNRLFAKSANIVNQERSETTPLPLSEPLAEAATVAARRAVASTLQELQRQKTQTGRDVVAAAAAAQVPCPHRPNMSTDTTTTWPQIVAQHLEMTMFVDRTPTAVLRDASDNTLTIFAQWEAILDAILAQVSRSGGHGKCRGHRHRPKTCAEPAALELWLGRHVLQHWLTVSGNNSTSGTTLMTLERSSSDKETQRQAPLFWSRMLCLDDADMHNRHHDTRSGDDPFKTIRRRRQLAVLNVLHTWLSECYCSDQDTVTSTAMAATNETLLIQIRSLVIHVLPRLIDRAMAMLSTDSERNPHHPTVLEQRVLDVVYLIVVLASKTVATQKCNGIGNEEAADVLSPELMLVEDALAQQVDPFQQLLRARRDWLQRRPCAKGGLVDGAEWSTLSKHEIREVCEAAILMDWIEVLECAISSSDSGDEKCNVRLWCQRLSGCQLDEAGNFGYSVAAIGDDSSKDYVLSKTGLESDVFNERTRSDVRCLLAWLSRRTKHLHSLGSEEVLTVSKWLLDIVITSSSPSLNTMAVFAVKLLWSLTGGLPTDVVPLSTKGDASDVSKSFHGILRSLDSLRNGDTGATPHQYLIESAMGCALVGGDVYVELLLSKAPTSPDAVDIRRNDQVFAHPINEHCRGQLVARHHLRGASEALPD